MIDSNERLTLLQSRHTDNLSKRVIETVLDSYITIKGNSVVVSPTFFEEKVRAVKNSLFIKYSGIEFEGLFQGISVDNEL